MTPERAPKHRGEVVLRAATAQDAEAGADLQRICWHEAYTGHTDPKVLAARLADRDRWVEAWRTQLASGPPRVVAEEDGVLIGFAVAGPTRDQDAPVPEELYALYTREAYWGSGLGNRLLRAVLPRERAASLWVLSTNERARRFYARHGFHPDGAHHRYAGLDVEEIRLVRAGVTADGRTVRLS